VDLSRSDVWFLLGLVIGSASTWAVVLLALGHFIRT